MLVYYCCLDTFHMSPIFRSNKNENKKKLYNYLNDRARLTMVMQLLCNLFLLSSCGPQQSGPLGESNVDFGSLPGFM